MPAHMERRTLIFGRDLRQVATWLVVAGAILAFIAGTVVLLLSLRPSHLRLREGEIATYRLVARWTEQHGEGKERRDGASSDDQRLVQLIGVGPDNLVGLIADDQGRDRFTMLRLGVDGSATLLDPAERPLPGGKAISVLDLNLFQLPPDGLEQTWETTIPYGLLPDVRRQLRVKVRRTTSSANPGFTLKPEAPAIEWLDQGRYRQLKDLTALYRFNARKRCIDQAQITALYSEELPPPATWRRWKVDLRLDLLSHELQEADPSWRRLAVSTLAAQQALSDGSITATRRQELARDLRQAAPGVPRWQALATGLAEAVLQSPRQTSASRWYLSVWDGPADQRAAAEQLAASLSGNGMTAAVVGTARGIAVELGPYPRQDRQAIDRLRVLAPTLAPRWREER